MMRNIKAMIGTLEAFNLPGNSNSPDGEPMQIFVKMGVETVLLDVKTSDVVQHVKALLYNREKWLIVAGKQLEDGRKLSSYKILNETTLHESGRLRAGELVKKTHMSKDEATKVLQQKVNGVR